MDFEKGELLIITKNNKYHCPLEYCLWEEQDEHPDYIPEYEKIKEKYKDKIQYPSIEPGKVLIVLADFCPYYFHSAYYVPEGQKQMNHFQFLIILILVCFRIVIS